MTLLPIAVTTPLGVKKVALLLPYVVGQRFKFISLFMFGGAMILTAGMLNSYKLAANNVSLFDLAATTTTTSTTTTTTTTVATRTAICYTNQFNSAQANQYFVLTQRDGESVRLQGNALGDLVTDTTVPLFLKPGGDESCSMDSIATLAPTGTFDLSEMNYAITLPSTFSITNGGTDLNGMNISVNNLNNGCCTIQRIL